MIRIEKNLIYIKTNIPVRSHELYVIDALGGTFKEDCVVVDINSTSKVAMTNYLNIFAPELVHDELYKEIRMQLYSYLKSYYTALDKHLVAVLSTSVPYFSHMKQQQIDSALWIHQRYFSVIALQQGLGKSLSAISADIMLRTHDSKYATGCCLVVTQAVGKYNFEGELVEKWGINRKFVMVVDSSKNYTPAHFEGKVYIIINYDVLKKNLGVMLSIKPSMIVVDECTKIKNTSSDAFITTKAIVKHHHSVKNIKRLVLMSGTPIKNWSDDLLSYFNLGGKKIGASKTAFKKMFIEYEYNEFTGFSSVKGSKNEEHLKILLSNILIRRTHDDSNAEYKGKEWIIHPVNAKDVNDQINSIWSTITKSTSRFELDSKILAINKVTSSAKIENDIELILNLISQGKKVTFFSFFTHTIETIVRRLTDMGIVTFVATGRQNAKKKFQAAANFTSHPTACVFVGQTLASGVSLNLQCSNDIIMGDLPLTWADLEQVVFRLIRIGQAHKVNIWVVTAANTVDEKIADLIIRKQQSASMIIDDGSTEVSTLIGDGGGSSAIDTLSSGVDSLDELENFEIKI